MAGRNNLNPQPFPRPDLQSANPPPIGRSNGTTPSFPTMSGSFIGRSSSGAALWGVGRGGGVGSAKPTTISSNSSTSSPNILQKQPSHISNDSVSQNPSTFGRNFQTSERASSSNLSHQPPSGSLVTNFPNINTTNTDTRTYSVHDTYGNISNNQKNANSMMQHNSPITKANLPTGQVSQQYNDEAKNKIQQSRLNHPGSHNEHEKPLFRSHISNPTSSAPNAPNAPKIAPNQHISSITRPFDQTLFEGATHKTLSGQADSSFDSRSKAGLNSPTSVNPSTIVSNHSMMNVSHSAISVNSSTYPTNPSTMSVSPVARTKPPPFKYRTSNSKKPDDTTTAYPSVQQPTQAQTTVNNSYSNQQNQTSNYKPAVTNLLSDAAWAAANFQEATSISDFSVLNSTSNSINASDLISSTCSSSIATTVQQTNPTLSTAGKFETIPEKSAPQMQTRTAQSSAYLDRSKNVNNQLNSNFDDNLLVSTSRPTALNVNAETNANLSQIEKENAELKRALAQYQQEQKQLRNDLISQKSKIESLQTEVSKRDSQIIQVKKEADKQAEERFMKMRSEVEEKKKEIERLKSRLDFVEIESEIGDFPKPQKPGSITHAPTHTNSSMQFDLLDEILNESSTKQSNAIAPKQPLLSPQPLKQSHLATSSSLVNHSMPSKPMSPQTETNSISKQDSNMSSHAPSTTASPANCDNSAPLNSKKRSRTEHAARNCILKQNERRQKIAKLSDNFPILNHISAIQKESGSRDSKKKLSNHFYRIVDPEGPFYWLISNQDFIMNDLAKIALRDLQTAVSQILLGIHEESYIFKSLSELLVHTISHLVSLRTNPHQANLSTSNRASTSSLKSNGPMVTIPVISTSSTLRRSSVASIEQTPILGTNSSTSSNPVQLANLVNQPHHRSTYLDYLKTLHVIHNCVKTALIVSETSKHAKNTLLKGKLSPSSENSERTTVDHNCLNYSTKNPRLIIKVSSSNGESSIQTNQIEEKFNRQTNTEPRHLETQCIEIPILILETLSSNFDIMFENGYEQMPDFFPIDSAEVGFVQDNLSTHDLATMKYHIIQLFHSSFVDFDFSVRSPSDSTKNADTVQHSIRSRLNSIVGPLLTSKIILNDIFKQINTHKSSKNQSKNLTSYLEVSRITTCRLFLLILIQVSQICKTFGFSLLSLKSSMDGPTIDFSHLIWNASFVLVSDYHNNVKQLRRINEISPKIENQLFFTRFIASLIESHFDLFKLILVDYYVSDDKSSTSNAQVTEVAEEEARAPKSSTSQGQTKFTANQVALFLMRFAFSLSDEISRLFSTNDNLSKNEEYLLSCSGSLFFSLMKNDPDHLMTSLLFIEESINLLIEILKHIPSMNTVLKTSTCLWTTLRILDTAAIDPNQNLPSDPNQMQDDSNLKHEQLGPSLGYSSSAEAGKRSEELFNSVKDKIHKSAKSLKLLLHPFTSPK